VLVRVNGQGFALRGHDAELDDIVNAWKVSLMLLARQEEICTYPTHAWPTRGCVLRPLPSHLKHQQTLHCPRRQPDLFRVRRGTLHPIVLRHRG
jgi:hypothetical protein